MNGRAYAKEKNQIRKGKAARVALLSGPLSGRKSRSTRGQIFEKSNKDRNAASSRVKYTSGKLNDSKREKGRKREG